MADYIYLLQNRLTPAQRAALEAVREAARAQSMPVFLVGGAVRDLTSGAPVRDLDFAVQGEVAPLLADLQAARATIAGENPVLKSTFLLFPGGVRAELGPTLTVSYPKPGQPETQSAAILDDLRRRDFTANAMAISLNEGSFGLLLDPLNGIADIENRELRLSSNYGFIEQPALLLRAARLTERLGWSLEERTQTRYDNAKEEGTIQALPAWDKGYELEEVFHEEDPVSALEHLRSEGWADTLFPALDPGNVDTSGIDRMRDLLGQMEQIGIHTDASPVLLPLVAAKLPSDALSELMSLFPRQGFRQQIDSLEARGKELSAQLTAKAATPSETWKLLFAAEPEVVLWTALHARTPAVQNKFKGFLHDWPQMRQRVPHALMQEMRITPDLPGYDQLLMDLFFAQIDGKLPTPEATREFLEPFSPPAPVVQLAPRRRAAKSTRGRGRKAQDTAAVEPDEEDLPRQDDDEDEDETPARETEHEDSSDSEDSDEEEDDASPEPQPEPIAAVKMSAKKTVAPKQEADPKKTPAASRQKPEGVPAAEVKAPSAKESLPASGKAAKGSTSVASAKASEKPSEKPKLPVKKATPVTSTKPASAKLPEVKSAQGKVGKVPAKPDVRSAKSSVGQTKAPVKVAPVKAASAVKQVVKVVAKKVAAKQTPPPSSAAKKAVATKKVVAKKGSR